LQLVLNVDNFGLKLIDAEELKVLCILIGVKAYILYHFGVDLVMLLPFVLGILYSCLINKLRNELIEDKCHINEDDSQEEVHEDIAKLPSQVHVGHEVCKQEKGVVHE
jgi:hypothetical protein